MIVPRLVLGTARIAGGASESQAIDLIRCALDHGIAQIDTAPSYGLGTAEAVVGKAIRGRGGVAVATKLGSAQPSLPWLRTMMRRVKRTVAGPGTGAAALPRALVTSPTGNAFTAAAMEASLARSLDRLGRIDMLLLHDISAAELSDHVLSDLVRLSADAGAKPGYAIFARWNEEFDARFAAGMTAQCALDPRWLLADRTAPPARSLRLHSIGKTGLALAAENASFATGLEKAAMAISGSDRQTAQLAAIYALAATRLPDAHLLLTSSHRRRLDALLSAIAAIDAAGTRDEIAALFAG